MERRIKLHKEFASKWFTFFASKSNCVAEFHRAFLNPICGEEYYCRPTVTEEKITLCLWEPSESVSLICSPAKFEVLNLISSKPVYSPMSTDEALSDSKHLVEEASQNSLVIGFFFFAPQPWRNTTRGYESILGLLWWGQSDSMEKTFLIKLQNTRLYFPSTCLTAPGLDDLLIPFKLNYIIKEVEYCISTQAWMMHVADPPSS